MRYGDDELIGPGSFLPAAERFRQIGAIDRWVIGQAIEILHQPAAPRILHVNLSGHAATNEEHRRRSEGSSEWLGPSFIATLDKLYYV